ncbi:hypothetical protein [Clavibacter michiganensis]|uniref:hypothetical protein n=1 Tax=Clavibacter michiganensis TaxID=28447 RepID=UPI001F4E021F|nr:hypothetical protein [Clavibacter michiganensis]
MSGRTVTSSNATACVGDDEERYDQTRVADPAVRRAAPESTAAACHAGTAAPSGQTRASTATADEPDTRD